MGIYDRDYNKDPNAGGRMRGMGRGGARIVLPPLTPVVKWLLITNVAIFIIGKLFDPTEKLLFPFFSVSTITPGQSLQLWRIISYQFLHAGIGHIFRNMLFLYFFGPMLEQLWGSKRFLWFYLVCGAMGGIFYPLLVFFNVLGPGYLIGASGAIFGILAAGGILFSRMRVFIMGIVPIPLGVLAGIFALISILTLLNVQGANRGGEAAHIAGMAAGAVYVLWPQVTRRMRHKQNQGRWEKKIVEQRDFQREVDRILTKVHNSGVASLTRNEKKILQEATEREQQS